MTSGDRSALLTTACDDLQAQLEAGDRSARHLDEDLVLLAATAGSTATSNANTLAALQRHLNELRRNMREQRVALREVRAAGHALCASMARTRDSMKALKDQNDALQCQTGDEEPERDVPTRDLAD
jgi:hypothetical protein